MYNSIGRQSSYYDPWKYINISESGGQSETPKRKPLRIVFEPFIFTLLLLFFLCMIVIFVYYLIILLPPVILNFNNLVENTIPNELEYYHSLLKQHNQTLNLIENNILSYMNVSDIIINPNTLQKSNQAIQNMVLITSSLNITQIQMNLEEIVSILNRVLPH